MANEDHDPNWQKAGAALKDMLDDMGLKTAQYPQQLETYGDEEQRRGIPTLIMHQLAAGGMRLGARMSFTDNPGDGLSENIDCIVVGIFIDGFAFVRLRPKEEK
jgi:hypothetical protein